MEEPLHFLASNEVRKNEREMEERVEKPHHYFCPSDVWKGIEIERGR